MGEGGIDPRYFLYEMKCWECRLYIDGFNRRYRPIFTNFRWLIQTILGMFSSNEKVPSDPVKFYRFPWETENEEECEENEEEINAFFESIDKHNESVDKMKAAQW